MLAGVLAAVVAVAVAWGPGAILCLAVGRGRQRWLALAAAPALTLGLVTVAMGWLPRVGMPNGVVAVLLTELAVAAGVVLVSRVAPRLYPRLVSRRRTAAPVGGGHADALEPPVRRTRLLPDVVGLAVPAVIATVYGWVVLGRFNAPPGWDAMNHGLLTRRILDTGSTSIPDVCSTGPVDPAVACSLYPLSANVTWAQTAHLSGARIGEVMTLWLVLVAPLALVAGVYALVRMFGVHPFVAGAAALAPAFVGPMWTSMLIGRPTQQFGPALAPAIAVLVVAALRGPDALRLGVLAGLAGGGLVMTHSYDALPIPVLTLGALLALGVRQLRWRPVVAGAGALAAASFVTIAPFLTRLLSAEASLGQTPPSYVGRVGVAAHYWVLNPLRYVLLGYPPPESGRDFPLHEPQVVVALVVTVAGLVAAPLCLVFRRLRWGWPWLLTWAVFTGLGIWTSSSSSPTAQGIAGLWYGTRDRLRSMILYSYGVLAVVGICALALLAVRLVSLARRKRAEPRRGWAEWVPAAGTTLFLCVLVTTAVMPQTWRPLREDLARRTPNAAAYPRVFTWLQQHTRTGEVVAGAGNREYVPWAYIDYGVPVLVGQVPHTEPASARNYSNRWVAWNWLVGRSPAKPAGCLVRHFGIRYVVTSRTHVPGNWPKRYDAKQLRRSPNLVPVHRDGPVTVWQVTDKGSACQQEAST
ncbi:hypothetical protein FBY26_3466 [Phycicoccus sp. SLBN-51]|nr:hypothetical protein FBY26_3466 [Phycicoccus sp. SLBN-51]